MSAGSRPRSREARAVGGADLAPDAAPPCRMHVGDAEASRRSRPARRARHHTSPPWAKALTASRTAAALLLTTSAASAPVSSRRAGHGAVAWPRSPPARSNSRFEYPEAVPPRGDAGSAEGSAAQVGVDDDAGGVDHAPHMPMAERFQGSVHRLEQGIRHGPGAGFAEPRIARQHRPSHRIQRVSYSVNHGLAREMGGKLPSRLGFHQLLDLR